MRIVIAEDTALLREGLVGILRSGGHDVTAAVADAHALRACLNGPDTLPDLLLTDVRMPPDNTDDGLRAALDLRRRFPGLPVMVLSAYVAGPYVATLLDDSTNGGVGYLLKERVGRVDDFLRQLDVVAAGGVVIDPEVVQFLVRDGAPSALSHLTSREREVMRLIAEGLSNTQICEHLYLSEAAVGKHVSNIFNKLGLPAGEDNRRVRAVLAWLRAMGS